MKKSKILSVVLIVSVMISAMSVFSLGISADEYTESSTPISLTSPYASSKIIVDGTVGDDEEYTDAIDLDLWISGVKPDYAQYNVDNDYCYRDYAAKTGYEQFVVPTIRVANDNEYVYIYVEAYRFYNNLTNDTKSGELYIQLGFNGKNGTNNTSGEWVSLAIRTCEDTAKLSKDMIISAATVSDSTVSYTEYSDTDAMSNVEYSLKYTNGENAQQGGSVEAKFPIPESVKSQISTGNDVQIDLSVFLNNNKGENNYSTGRKTSGFGLYGGFAYDGTDVGAKLTLTTSGVISDNDQNNENNNTNTPTDTDGETSSTEKSETTEVSNTEKDTSASTSDEQKGGCGSSVASVGVVLLAACACGCSIIPKRKTTKKKEKNYEEI